MIVHSSNREMKVINGAVSFDAWYSHVEDAGGKHVFVVAVPPESQNQLIAARSLISSNLKKNFSIKSNADLTYIERHPDGQLYQVNLENLGQGPGAFGEPEHAKVVAYPVSHKVVQARLGEAATPAPSPQTPPIDPDVNLNQGGLPKLSGTERRKAQQKYKPKL